MKETVSLETIANGAATERFNEAFKTVLINIHDINTSATQTAKKKEPDFMNFADSGNYLLWPMLTIKTCRYWHNKKK